MRLGEALASKGPATHELPGPGRALSTSTRLVTPAWATFLTGPCYCHTRSTANANHKTSQPTQKGTAINSVDTLRTAFSQPAVLEFYATNVGSHHTVLHLARCGPHGRVSLIRVNA